jgi:DNA-directed RNA polymerase specialized sigma24 family protein
MTEPSDEELVARVVTHSDGRAFEKLVRRHQSRVRNWLRQLTRDPAYADDLAQDVFIVVWERAYSFAGKGSFAAWVMKVAYNQYLQARRNMPLGTVKSHVQRGRAKIRAKFGVPKARECSGGKE